MACPHSSIPSASPDNCSQCRMASANKVTISNGVVAINGKAVGRLDDMNRMRYEEETQRAVPQHRKTCSMCGKSGHNSRTCPLRNPGQEVA